MTFAYDSLGRLTSAANPESGTITYGYDNNGNLTSKTDARTTGGSNWTTTIAYDALNRVITKSYSNDGGVTPPVNYYYDNASLPSGAPSFTRGYSGGIMHSSAGIFFARAFLVFFLVIATRHFTL